MKLRETTHKDVTSLHVELNMWEKIRYPALSSNFVNIVITFVLFLILLVWIIRNDGIPGATEREAIALVVILPLMLFAILTFYNYWTLSDYQKNKLCLIQLKPRTKQFKLSTSEEWVVVQAVIYIPRNIAILLEDQKIENFEEFPQFYSIYYDFNLRNVDAKKYQELVDKITNRVCRLLGVSSIDFIEYQKSQNLETD